MDIDRNVIKPTITESLYVPVEVLQSGLEKKGPEIGLWRTCITCMKFVENTEHCSQFGARPPARVIAYGCPAYENDEIPF